MSDGAGGRRTSVTIDARILRGDFSGAQAATLELIELLGPLRELSVRALVDPAIGPEAQAVIERAGVEPLPFAQAGPGVARTDVVHRPYQVTSEEDLELLARLGERLVVTQLDLIAFRHRDYFESAQDWRRHQDLTRRALARTDRVVFLSEHAAAEAVAERLVEQERCDVVPMVLMAVDSDQPVAGSRPDGAPRGEFLLTIGNDFRHKNRPFAIELLARLRERGWEGSLVLAGANVGAGSSRSQEAEYLARHRELAPFVHDLPAVSEAEKTWLYAHAAAVAYPSSDEGFGLIPFEAARAGVPCLFAHQASLAELLPAEAAVLDLADAESSAERALPLLRQGPERERRLELVADAARRLGDADSARAKLLAVYRRALAGEPRAGRAGGALAGAIPRLAAGLRRAGDRLLRR
jgi:glycosyltransferase involved in cell wall biosynthesis